MDFYSNSSSSDSVDYDTDIFNAITYNDIGLIDQYINEDLINLNHRDGGNSGGHTFLTRAVFLLRLEVVDLLLNWGADPNFPEAINGNTPLDIAYTVIPSFRPETQENLHLRDQIVQLLVNNGGQRTQQDLSSLSSEPSDPDYKLMNNQAATIIQNMVRERQDKQRSGIIRKKVGRRSADPSPMERSRMYYEHLNSLDPFDPYRQYAHIPFFSTSKIKSPRKRRVKGKGKRK